MEIMCVVLSFILWFIVASYVDYLTFKRWKEKNNIIERLDFLESGQCMLFEEVYKLNELKEEVF